MWGADYLSTFGIWFAYSGYVITSTAISTLLLFSSRIPLAAGGPIGKAEVQILTNQTIALHYIEGYEVREKPGGELYDGSVVLEPLDVKLATELDNYTITSPSHSSYVNGQHPTRIGRKMKGRDFVNEGGKKTSFVPEHWVYLDLQSPLMERVEYTMDLSKVLPNQPKIKFQFNSTKSRSEVIHTNQVGYKTSGKKTAYLSAWLGDQGRFELAAFVDKGFQLIDQATGKSVFSGLITLRKSWEEKDTVREEEIIAANHAQADVYECDFSSFKTPGKYKVSVPKLGTSYPFVIRDNAFDTPFITTTRALYHQRSGIALKEPFTKLTRPVDQLPSIKPMQQTKTRYMDQPYHDGWEITKVKPETTGENRNVWGGYHDAGDWDREDWHPGVAVALLTAFELNPKAFKDGELNIPESGNGIPDVIDEAKWGIDYYLRLQRPDGGVSVGLFEDSWPRPEESSWRDSMKWYIYAEDPSISYKFAMIAAKLAYVYGSIGKPELGKPYIAAAEKAWDWAGKNLREGDELKVRDPRFDAAAELYRVTKKPLYHDQFRRDCMITNRDSVLRIWGQYDQANGAYTYLMTNNNLVDPSLRDRLFGAMLNHAKAEGLGAVKLHSYRFASITDKPIDWGTAGQLNIRPLMFAHYFTKDASYLDAMIESAGYVLGANPLDMSWITGVGARSPSEVMDIDSWYVRDGKPTPGINIFGPHTYVKEKAAGPWEPGWAQQNACYPSAEQWPTLELWFENRMCPSTNEYTVTNIAETAMGFGYLRSAALVSPKPKVSPVVKPKAPLVKPGALTKKNSPAK